MPSIPFSSSPSPTHPHHHHHHHKPTTHGISTLISASSIATNSHQPIPVLSSLRSFVNTGRMREARALFSAMPDKTSVSWTILMSGYALHGPATEALSLFRAILSELSANGLWPDPFVFSVVLRTCSSSGSLSHGKELHCTILKLNYIEDLFLANGLVTMYANCGSLRDSASVFRGIQHPDLVSWTAMLSGCIKNGHDEEAMRLFVEFAQLGFEFDAFLLSTGLKASANLCSVESGIRIHCIIIKLGFNSCLFLKNCLLEFYGGINELVMARKLFDEMLEKDLVSWNTVISCHARNRCSEEALRLFCRMMGEGFECDDFTLGSVIRAITDSGALSHGKEIHGYIIRAGFESNSYVISALLEMYIECITCGMSDAITDIVPLKLFRQFSSSGTEHDEFIIASILKYCALQQDLHTGMMIHSCILKLEMKSDPFVVSSLIDMYAKCGIIEASLQVFAGIKGPRTVQLSALMAGHCQNGQFQEALQLLRRMHLNCMKANEFIYTCALQACIALGDIKTGKEIHCSIIRSGHESNASVVNNLINLYSELRQPFLALKLRSSISDNNISWGSLIKALGRNEEHDAILKLFHNIQCSNGQLDHSSVRYVLNSCGSLLLLNAGTQIHGYIMKRGLISDTGMNNALVDMYSRCGVPADADNAFSQSPRKNSTSWTSIIAASVNHGRLTQALELFMQMTNKGKSPDSDTFVSILKACARLGLVDESFRFFMLMCKVYKIKPSAEHYSCMVEVLGRVGLFREAEHFINSVIPTEPTAPAWRALLSSCQAHQHLYVSKHVAEKLIELEPSDSMANLLLEQVSLASGDWSSASKIAKGTLETSSSWIEVRDSIHEFISEQNVTEEISAKLMELTEKMKELDYVADTSHWMQNREEYIGEGSYHTELMALAYGLVSLPHAAPLRVVKSARMCPYCHSACKFISTFVARDMVIKDSCNFHHFKNGRCSCRDQW